MPVHSSLGDRLSFCLTPIQLVCRPPRALRKSEVRYDTSAEVLVKWLAGSSRRGRAVFSTQLPLDLTVDGSTECAQLVFSLTGGDAIVFETNMHRKPQDKRKSGAVLYRKKMLQLDTTLLVRKRKNIRVQNTKNEATFEVKEDTIARVCSFSLARCSIDLRDLLPGGDLPHRVRLGMAHRHDYMDVDCLVQSSQDTLIPGERDNAEDDRRSTCIDRCTSSCAPVTTGRSECVATSTLSVSGAEENGEEPAETHSSGVLSAEVLPCSHKCSDYPLLSTACDAPIPLVQEEISRLEEMSSIHSIVHYLLHEQEQGQLTGTQSSVILAMVPMPNADLSTVYEYCETSARSVALFHQHGGDTTTSRPPFSPLQQVLREGVSCEQEFAEDDPMKLFHMLFPQQSGPCALMPALHSRRRDNEYPTTCTWLEVPEAYPHVAYYTTPYKMRYRKDQSLDADEYGVIVAAGDRVVAHVMSVAPEFPLVGSNLRLELLVEIMRGGLVRAVLFLCVPKKLQLLMRSPITSQRVKLETLLRGTLSELAHLISREVADTTVATETPAVLMLRLSSSVDPNIWRSLRSAEIFSHEAHVEVVLLRLQQIDLPYSSECESLVRTLEELVCMHHNSAAVVRLVTLLLMRVSKERMDVAKLIKTSPTLATTLQQVYAIQPLSSLFAAEAAIPHLGDNQTNNSDENKTNPLRMVDVEAFLKSLDVCAALQQETRRRELSTLQNVWEVLSVNVGDRVATSEIVRRIRSKQMLLSSERQCRLLNAALVLHMDYAPIAIAILEIMIHNYHYNDSPFFSELKPLTAGFIFAIRRAMNIYHENLAVENVDSLLAVRDAFAEALEKRSSNLSYFEKHFVPVLPEEPLFTCKVSYIHTTMCRSDSAEVMLTVTASFLCIGSNAVPLVHIRRVRLYRHWWCLPAISLYIEAGRDSAALSLTERREETQHEISVVVWQRRELVSVLLERNSTILVEY